MRINNHMYRFAFLFAFLICMGCSSSLSDIPGATLIIASLSRDMAPQVDQNNLDAFRQANTSFAIDVYKKLKETDANFFFSPFGLSSVLSMVWAGSKGETSKQIASVLHYEDMEPTTVHTSHNYYDLMLDSKKDAILDDVNSIWAQKDFEWKKEYLELLKKHYGAGIYMVDFINNPSGSLKAMNRWVKKQTGGHIRDTFDKTSIDALTMICLLNVVYFQGAWEHKFKRSDTKLEHFNTLEDDMIQVEMMRRKETEFKIYWSDEYPLGTCAVEMPYRNSNLAMLVIIPTIKDFVQFENDLTVDALDEIINNMKAHEIELKFPRFESFFKYDFVNILKMMGMTDAFSLSKADFTNMTDKVGLFIADALQKTYIQVNEEGTTVVAFSGLNVKRGRPLSISANSPFIYLIRDTQTGLILFMGRMTNPSLLKANP